MSAEASSAFISYSRADSAFAFRLARDLKDAGADVWLDRLDIAPGEVWEVAIERALSRCSRMLVVLSPSSVDTRGVLDEVAFALKRKKTVIPILFLDCEIPYRLDPIQYVDFRVNYDSAFQELLLVLPRKPMQECAVVAMETPKPQPQVPIDITIQVPLPQVHSKEFSDPSAKTTSYFRRIPTWVKAIGAGVMGLGLLMALVSLKNLSSPPVGRSTTAVSVVPDPSDEAATVYSGYPNEHRDNTGGVSTLTSIPIAKPLAPASRVNHRPETDASAMNTTALKLINQKRYTKALPLAKGACELYDTSGCLTLGYLYRTGSGVAQDLPLATSLFRKVCESGDLRGCNNLGYMYSTGSGVAEDPVEGVSLYSRSCSGGVLEGCNNLGNMYENGTGVAKDLEQAASLYRKACNTAGSQGCSNLGYMYEHGSGVAKDPEQAVSLYRKACDIADMHGCSNLGTMYENGTGVAKNLKQAAVFYRKACDSGFTKACDSLKAMNQ